MKTLDITAVSLDDPLYYLRNTQQVITLCLSQYADLLTADETSQLQHLLRLDTQAQALLIRLVMRKGVLFRTDKLLYKEIPALDQALLALDAAGLITRSPCLSLSDLCHLARREECLQLARLHLKEQTVAAAIRKSDLVARLLDHHTEDANQPLSHWWPDAPFMIIELGCAALFDRLRLMFFGNLHQDWSEFVLTELGVQQFEPVPLTADSRPFQCRTEVDLYLTLHQLQQRVAAGETIDSIRQQLPAPVTSEWLEYRRRKVLYQLGREAERRQQLALALDLYEQSQHRDARLRTLRLLEKQAPPRDVFAWAATALTRIPQPEAHVSLQRIMQRSARKAGLPYTAPVSLTVPVEQQLLDKPELGRVEAAVMQHLSTEQTRLFHVENRLFNGLFALLFWPALFAPIRGAFFNPFQSGPADLYRPGFSDARTALLAEGFERLRTGDYRQVIQTRGQQKRGISSTFIHWPTLTPELINMSLELIPAAHLEAIFRHLLLDLRHHRKGMPDLLELNLATGHYRLLEVKGPGDRLQDHQRLWIQAMLAHELPVSVYNVSWAQP